LVQSLSSTLNEALAEAAHLHIHVAEWRLVTYNWVFTMRALSFNSYTYGLRCE
jgi:hypothetical protein